MGLKEKREQILKLTREFCEEKSNTDRKYNKGDRISYAGRVFDYEEMVNLVDASLDFWLTAGRYTEKFELEFARRLNVKYCSLVNSGSSANLVAFMTLTSSLLGERKINRGDEVITVAAGFPTTISPIIQYGAIPVFVDITIPEYNIDVAMLERALSDKTKAVMIAHTLGNPFNLKYVKEFCDKYELWLIEDNCDALGAMYKLDDTWKMTGTIGDIGTSSFYPPHHITMGEGGAVYTDNVTLHRIINSFRDWGRDCWCQPGNDGTCKNRYSQQFGTLPKGYDHKYVYSNFGYNLKSTDMQAAIGCAQLKKLECFSQKRNENWKYLRTSLQALNEYFILPEEAENSIPSWFGFVLTLRDNVLFSRDDITSYIETNNIQTRNLFAGNIIRQPCFDEYRRSEEGFRVVGELKNTDRIMNSTFWIGVYPGMNEEKLQFMCAVIKKYVVEKHRT